MPAIVREYGSWGLPPRSLRRERNDIRRERGRRLLGDERPGRAPELGAPEGDRREHRYAGDDLLAGASRHVARVHGAADPGPAFEGSQARVVQLGEVQPAVGSELEVDDRRATGDDDRAGGARPTGRMACAGLDSPDA